MAEQENSIVDLKKFLSTKEQPVTPEEMRDFWNALTEEEKLEFKRTKLD